MEGAQQRRFRIHHGLGRGGYGEVYKATMTSPGGLRAEVAVKLLRLDQHTDEDAVRRLRDEGKLMAALRHPTILRVYDLAVLEGRIGLVTEYVEGQDLAHCMEGDDAIDVRPLIEVIGLVAEGLLAAYEARAPDTGEPMQLIHRDIKPTNLRLSRHGEVKILDFGIARSEAVDREARTGSQATLGSLAFMSPERFEARPPGPEGDVFSLGCVLYEGLSGRRFYPDAVPVQMYRMAASLKAYDAHCDEAFAALEGVHPDVVALVRDMLAHDPDQRVVTRDVATRCEALLDLLDGPSLKRWCRERKWPEAEFVPTSYDGRTLTDGTLHTGALAHGWLPAKADDSETLQFENLATEEITGRRSPAAPITDERSLEVVVTAPTEVAPEDGRRSAVPLLVGGIVVVLLLGLVALVAGPSRRTDPPEPVPVAVPAPVAAPEPVPDPVPEPAPEPVAEPAPEPVVDQPAPEPAAPSPRPSSRPQPAPAPVAPAPEPLPAPAPAPTTEAKPDGVVEIRGEGARLDRLVAEDGRVYTSRDGTRAVPGGPYRIYAAVNGTSLDLGTISVPPDGRVTFDCNRLTLACERME